MSLAVSWLPIGVVLIQARASTRAAAAASSQGESCCGGWPGVGGAGFIDCRIGARTGTC